jgi:hypothetical protein
MHTHLNARLTPLGTERLLSQHIDNSELLKALSAQAGISLRTAYKWLARYRCGGHTSLADGRSVRRSQRRTTAWLISGRSLQPPAEAGFMKPRCPQ